MIAKKIDCPNCGFKKTIPDNQVKAFQARYVLDGNVMCPKCEQVYSPAQLASDRKQDLRERRRKQVSTTSPSNGEVETLAKRLETSSIWVFALIVIEGALTGFLFARSLDWLLVCVAVGALIATIPGYAVSLTLKFFACVLRLLAKD